MKQNRHSLQADATSLTLTLADQKGGGWVAKSFAGVLRRRLEPLLDTLQGGSLTVRWPDGDATSHGRSGHGVRARIDLHRPRALQRLLLDGQIGFAEGYLEGDWSSDDLPSLFALLLANEHLLSVLRPGNRFTAALNAVRHRLHRNSRRGSRRNIAYHYDLGNAFYRLWLDESMLYSAALYQRDDDTLEQAQVNKLDQIGDWLAPAAGMRVLEIGCGWGRLAEYLARRFQVHVDGISLSRQQLETANAERRVGADDGSYGSTTFHYRDYRDVEGEYDRIVSIEMFEAVGKDYWQTYFATLSARLRTDGIAVLQVITIDESRFERYARQPDFIQRYVFPGGMLPTHTHLLQLAGDAGFEVEETLRFGAGYARTLADWRARFQQRLEDVRALGYDERFLRLWQYYLDYCEAGFLQGSTDVALVRLRKRG